MECTREDFDLGILASGDPGHWAPEKGGVLFYRDSPHFSEKNVFVITLYFDQDAREFYEDNDWANIEVDIIFNDLNDLLPRIDLESVGSSYSGNIVAVRDTIVLDNVIENVTRGITILRPKNIDENDWTETVFTFALKDNPFDLFPQSGDSIEFHTNIQLIADVGKPSFYETIEDAIPSYKEAWIANYWLDWWKLGKDAGEFLAALGGYPAQTSIAYGEVFRMFTMVSNIRNPSQNTNSNNNPVVISDSTNGEGLCWKSNNALSDVSHCDESDFLVETGIFPQNGQLDVDGTFDESWYTYYDPDYFDTFEGGGLGEPLNMVCPDLAPPDCFAAIAIILD